MSVEKIRYEFVATGPVTVRVKDNEVLARLEEGDRLAVDTWEGIKRPTVTFRPAPIKDYTRP
jgi:hypothetical protein